MSDDLIEEARHIIECSGPYDVTLSKKLANALLARIGELESTCYRLTEERDRLKGWADKYHDEVLELQDRLAKAEADARERAARVLTRAAEEIRTLKPKASDTKKAGE